MAKDLKQDKFSYYLNFLILNKRCLNIVLLNFNGRTGEGNAFHVKLIDFLCILCENSSQHRKVIPYEYKL